MGKVDEQLEIIGCCGGDFCIGTDAHNKEITNLFASFIKETLPNRKESDIQNALNGGSNLYESMSDKQKEGWNNYRQAVIDNLKKRGIDIGKEGEDEK